MASTASPVASVKAAADHPDAPRVSHQPVHDNDVSSLNDDDAELAARMGHKSEFAREFKSLSTISYAFSIMGLVSSVATTMNLPFTLGGPASVVWTWFIGSCFNFLLGVSIAELVSAYPSSGGLYSASGLLVPKRYRATVAWFTGWLNFSGQIAGIAGTEFGLSQMIWAYAYVANGYVAGPGATVGLYIALLILHGLINSFGPKVLAKMTSYYVFVNLGATFVIIVLLLALTPRSEFKSASYTFGEVINASGWTNPGIAFLFGLYSVQFVMTDYDATAHISEEVHRAAIAAPVAIMIAVAGTGLAGWILNIVFVLASGDSLERGYLTWPGGLIFADILVSQAGRVAFLIIWWPVCATAFFVVTTALQANARTFYAFSRDKGLPDRGFFAVVNKRTGSTVNAVWLVVIPCIALGCLDFASYVAVASIFSLAALGMDLSYLVPILSRQIFQDHPEVQFQPGPFSLGRGWFGRIVNWIAICWVLFECTILCIPTIRPITAQNFNYSWVIAGGVSLITGVWYFAYAHRHYKGPLSTLTTSQLAKFGVLDRALPAVRDEENSSSSKLDIKDGEEKDTPKVADGEY